MKNWILFAAFALASSLILSACSEDSEMDDLSKAQSCLDKITDANHEDAEQCLSYVAKYNSQQANIIKCSGKFLAGGLTTSKIVDAYKEYENSEESAQDNKDAIFISYLALDPSSKATEAATFCRRTGVDGFIYLADLAVVGSILNDVAGGFSNPPTEAEINNALATCQATPLPASCQPEVLAEAVESVAGSYCDKPSAETDEVCQDIKSAISEAGGDSDTLTQALTCLLEGKTFTNGTCS